MTSFRSEFIETGQPDVRIHVSLSEPTPSSAQPDGSKPTIVFLHFWGGSTRTWTDVPAQVAGTGGYPTASIDFRGWGLSTGPADAGAYSIVQLADDVVAVLTKIGLTRVVLVGVSMGAKVAQVVAHRLLTSNTASVSMVAAILCSPAPATALQLPEDMREQQLHAYDSTESASFVARNVLTESFKDQSKPLPGFFVEDMLCGNAQARAAWPAYGMAEDVTATSLSSLASPPPVLVLAAEKDIVEPLERVKSGVRATVRGAELEVVAGSGHLSSIDAPGAVADAIVKFVDRAANQTV